LPPSTRRFLPAIIQEGEIWWAAQSFPVIP
jgi:hypothetical protein